MEKESKMEKILNEMIRSSEMISNSNSLTSKNNIVSPIAAIVYDPSNFKIIYNEKNIGRKLNQHAESLILKKIICDKREIEVKNYNLIVTCPPCSSCINQFKKKNINFRKIEWLTSLGKDEELGNLTKEKYGEIMKNSGTYFFEGKADKLRLVASYRWIEYKFNKILDKMEIKEWFDSLE